MAALCYKVTGVLKAETQLHIGSGQRTGVIKRTLGFIPGSTLRGAVGTSFIKSVCKLDCPLIRHEDCQHFSECSYATLFGEEFGKASNIFFRYAYPVHLKCLGTYLPAPKNLYLCKNPQCRKMYETLSPPEKCDCKEDLRLYSGFQCSRCREVTEHPIDFSRTTSTALDRYLVSAAMVGGSKEPAGTLHTTETIKKGSKFAVELLVSESSGNCLDSLKAIFERGLEDEGIGGGKSRGLGKAIVEDLKVEEVTEEALRKRASEIDTRCFVVRLVSPMLLGGRMLDDKSLLEGCRRSFSYLFHEGKPKLPDVKLKASRVDSEAFSGWSLKTEKRRRIEPAISAGSVFQFECEANDETLALSLAALEFHAIGAYKPHGCGQLRVEMCK